MEERILRRLRSSIVTYCVPDIHWKFDIVGRAGTGVFGL